MNNFKTEIDAIIKTLEPVMFKNVDQPTFLHSPYEGCIEFEVNKKYIKLNKRKYAYEATSLATALEVAKSMRSRYDRLEEANARHVSAGLKKVSLYPGTGHVDRFKTRVYPIHREDECEMLLQYMEEELKKAA